jgi:hypothetical protein
MPAVLVGVARNAVFPLMALRKSCGSDTNRRAKRPAAEEQLCAIIVA